MSSSIKHSVQLSDNNIEPVRLVSIPREPGRSWFYSDRKRTGRKVLDSTSRYLLQYLCGSSSIKHRRRFLSARSLLFASTCCCGLCCFWCDYTQPETPSFFFSFSSIIRGRELHIVLQHTEQSLMISVNEPLTFFPYMSVRLFLFSISRRYKLGIW